MMFYFHYDIVHCHYKTYSYCANINKILNYQTLYDMKPMHNVGFAIEFEMPSIRYWLKQPLNVSTMNVECILFLTNNILISVHEELSRKIRALA